MVVLENASDCLQQLFLLLDREFFECLSNFSLYFRLEIIPLLSDLLILRSFFLFGSLGGDGSWSGA